MNTFQTWLAVAGVMLGIVLSGADALAAPPGWTCPTSWYDDGVCDCGCVVPDSDCAGSQASTCDYCNGASTGGCSEVPGCPGTIDPSDNRSCDGPTGWTCPDSFYADGYCDCGCGVQDFDCAGPLASECDRCRPAYADGCNSSSFCPGSIDANNNATCNNAPPPDWTCVVGYYDDGLCDCGCGARDADCADGRASSCDYCNAASSGGCNSTTACPGDILPFDNATCSAPASWTCSEHLWADGSCDCGCGALDLDCVDGSRDSCDTCRTFLEGGCSSTLNCSNVLINANWLCTN
ncbi:MAG: hypothetical protein AAF602_06830 [Myxococcota bacterium]